MYGICPKCNKNNILINLYGMPNIAHVEDMERKGVFFNIKGCEPPPAQNAFAYQSTLLLLVYHFLYSY